MDKTNTNTSSKNTETKSLKMNNLDELFLNLTDNPVGFENKDMDQDLLALIYRIIFPL